MCVLSKVELSLPRIDQMTAGMTTTDKYKEFPVSIKLVPDAGHMGTWPEVQITEFTIEIKYNPKWMKYNGSVTPGEVLKNWVLTANEVLHSETICFVVCSRKGWIANRQGWKTFQSKLLNSAFR
jgi:hypothetical protein